MPFSSIAELPAAVRGRLSPPEQRQWLAVFNDVFAATEGSESDKETAAFRAANGALQKMEFNRTVPITKRNDEQQIVWGWAYVQEEHGQQVVDVSRQTVDDPLEIQKAAHGFVRDSRKGGVMHKAEGGEIVDSMFFSKDVQLALGIDLHKVGWFIGYHVTDPNAWAAVKSGELSAFSIAGTAIEEEIEGHAA